jgi:tryptophan-rich hypothetical protein
MMNKRQKFPHLLGSKWTTTDNAWVWRHFQVVNRSKQGKWIFVEMVASCDSNVRFWVNAEKLFKGSNWLSGWCSLEEIKKMDNSKL